jgi:hypothetical protein
MHAQQIGAGCRWGCCDLQAHALTGGQQCLSPSVDFVVGTDLATHQEEAWGVAKLDRVEEGLQ